MPGEGIVMPWPDSWSLEVGTWPLNREIRLTGSAGADMSPVSVSTCRIGADEPATFNILLGTNGARMMLRLWEMHATDLNRLILEYSMVRILSFWFHHIRSVLVAICFGLPDHL